MAVAKVTDAAYQRCIDPDCGAAAGLEDTRFVCPTCGGLLDVQYDRNRLPPPRSLREFDDKPAASGVWRFRELLPFAAPENIVSIGEGRTLLQQADAVQPNHYLILQNLGMIYADPRFDPQGNSIATARRMFDRSIKIKPDDYYGRQQLAALAVRQAYLWGPEFVDSNLINEALRFGNAARELRPESNVTPVLLSQLYALRAALFTDQRKKKGGGRGARRRIARGSATGRCEPRSCGDCRFAIPLSATARNFR